MSSSRNMKVWSRCADCGAWDEDCTCIGGFDPENEESLIFYAEKLAGNLEFYEQEKARKELGYCNQKDCNQCLGRGGPDCHEYDYDYYRRFDPRDRRSHYYEDCDNYEDYPCSYCGDDDCMAASDNEDYNDCSWKVWAEELEDRRSDPLRQLATMGESWRVA